MVMMCWRVQLVMRNPATARSSFAASGMNRHSIPGERLEHLCQLEAHLSDQIRGQDHVIPRVVSVLHRGELGLATPGRPRGSFVFLGPIGVGKTELALAFTRHLFGDEKLFRFDMSEYQTQDSLGVLLGARVGEIGILGMALAKSSSGTLLFDEIEKAHPRVLDVFLQILDAARVTIASGETLDLSGFYIVCTSNLGSAEILNLQHSSFTTMERHVLAKAQQALRPKLFARITEKIVFQRLSYDVQLAIARVHIARELSFLRSKGFDFTADESVVSFLLQRGFNSRLGARPVRDAIEKHLRGAVVRATLSKTDARCAEFIVAGDELLLQPRQSTQPGEGSL